MSFYVRCNFFPTMPPSSGEILRASTLLTRFKARELSRQPVAVKQLNTGVDVPEFLNPFLSTAKAANANKHSGNRYSLRRQKELLKAARVLVQSSDYDANLVNFLPPGTKTTSRVSGGGVDKALAALGRAHSTLSVAGVTKPATILEKTASMNPPEVFWRGTPRPRKPIGMYEGRKVAFKRHIWEREHKERQASIKKQVQSMEERIDTWRNVRRITTNARGLLTTVHAATKWQNSRNKASILTNICPWLI